MRPIRLLTASILLPAACCLAGAQSLSQIDTLAAAVVTDSPVLQKRSVSELSTDIEVIRAVVSPLGEGDAIRWAQTMPGVTTGADGTTAFYVRGSNMGNNLFSLDGVPIYGYTHLLGLTTVVPTSVIKDATLTKGGFDATDNNFTSAHLRIDSRRPDRGYRVSGAINNFLVSAGGEANFNDRISFVASARISPLTLEYQAFKGIASSLVGGISGFNAQIGDLYGKFRWDINSRNSLELFGLGTLDRYSLSLSEDSRQGMGWHNGIAQLRYAHEGERGRFSASVSYNRYGSSQEEDKVYREVRNHLSLKSDMTEVTARVDRLRRAGRRERVELSYGAKYRYAQFEPGQVGAINNLAHVHLADAYFQFRYSIPEKLEIKANARGNFFQNSKDRLWYIDPSGSALARWNISKTVTVEAGYDYLVQYYHSLEGLPVGGRCGTGTGTLVRRRVPVRIPRAQLLCEGVIHALEDHTQRLPELL